MSFNLLSDKQLEKLVLDHNYEIHISNIYQLYQIIDHTNLIIKEYYNTPDCHRCGICCSGVFDVTPVEAQVIWEALTGNYIPRGLFPPLPEETLAHRFNLAKKQLDTVLRDNSFICPFYHHQVGCLIYKVRTLICRVFEVAVPNFDFIDEIKEELFGKTAASNSGILCPNLKEAKEYPSTFVVWDLEGLTTLLEKMYPGAAVYEARLLSFFKYMEKDLDLNGIPSSFKLKDYIKVVSSVG
ncbi:YkgJ family cysteine cluster protein [Desulfolucanica intricata]|uniref:YkgJ family cysteine cluster protein n=1 Tax=Desulfolucanica intricata TaxID=1285191 RepID=UPI00082E5DBE|nr:YkgJ family cysteine cluster protein [Desulfolucanica intricata]